MPNEQVNEFSFGETPKQVVAELIGKLQDDKKWCSNNSIHWAEMRTYHIPKEVILFNLGILAFTGAVREQYNIEWMLFTSLFFSLLSIILSFYFVWVVTNQNINSSVKRERIIDRTLHSILNSVDLKELLNEYNKNMIEALNEMRGKEINWNRLQKTSIFCFLISITLAVVGLFCGK